MSQTHEVDDFTETIIRERVKVLLERAGYWRPTTHLLSYMGLARAKVTLNGHDQVVTYRLPLLGLDDPGIGRLMLFDALGDSVAERHPGIPPVLGGC
jgi:hypothetical protein